MLINVLVKMEYLQAGDNLIFDLKRQITYKKIFNLMLPYLDPCNLTFKNHRHNLLYTSTRHFGYLDINDISLFVDAHVSGQRNWACWGGKKSVTIKTCTEMQLITLTIMSIYDFTHHACERAWQTCTWFPSSCLLCSSWWLITGLRGKHIFVRL